MEKRKDGEKESWKDRKTKRQNWCLISTYNKERQKDILGVTTTS